MQVENDESRELAAEADGIEARAWSDWFAAMPPALRSEYGIEVRRIADATLLLAPRLPTMLFNRSIGLGMTRPATADALDAVVKEFVDAGCTTFSVSWGRYSEPAALTARLIERFPSESLQPCWAKMVRGPAPVGSSPSCNLRIVAVDRSLVSTFDRALVRANEMPFLAGILAPLYWRPGWHLYAAMERDEVVGGAALFLDGSRAWLGMAAVLPEYRRRGGQGALMSQRIRDAISAGAVRIFTETGEPVEKGANPSLNNVERSGFEKIYSRTQFTAGG